MESNTTIEQIEIESEFESSEEEVPQQPIQPAPKKQKTAERKVSIQF